MKIRLGLIGLGEAWNNRHAPALRSLGDRFEVRAVCEQVAHRAKQVADEFGATTAGGFQALLRREDIDAVLMLADQWYGPLPILAACEHRKAVYCAACSDLSISEADMICRQVDESGIAFMAEFLRRYTPGTLRLKELIATQLGEPRLLFCHQRLGLDCNDQKLNGRYIAHSPRRELIELVDWCRYLVAKEPTCVTGLMHPVPANNVPANNETESNQAAPSPTTPSPTALSIDGLPLDGNDYQAIALDFSDPGSPGTGPLAQISCSRYLPARWHEAINYRTPADLQIVCKRGVAFLDLPTTLIWYDDAGRHQEFLDNERPVGEQLLTHFFRAVTSLVRDRTDLEDACRSLMIVQQARQSSIDGRRIILEQ